MDAGAVANFFAIMLLGGAVGLAVALPFPSIRQKVTESGLALSALVAVGAMGGSLYFSEVAGFVPCELCWFQRIAMYPLAVILAIAVAVKDAAILRYVVVLASIGLVVAVYHVQLQLFPDQGSFCELANPCTSSPTKAFGWMTIPQMSALSFLLIATLASVSMYRPRREIT